LIRINDYFSSLFLIYIRPHYLRNVRNCCRT